LQSDLKKGIEFVWGGVGGGGVLVGGGVGGGGGGGVRMV